MPKYRVTETQVFEVEADDAESAEGIVRDGVSHTDELVAASLSFEIPERDVEEVA